MQDEKFSKVKRCMLVNLERLGQTRVNSQGEEMFIVEYNSSRDVTIQFTLNGELSKCTYGQFIEGSVRNHSSPSVYGVGITGKEVLTDENNIRLGSYQCWLDMLKRCYSIKYHEKNPTYVECIVSKEWLTYSNFKRWYNENYYTVDNGEKTELDKDILCKGNKIYSQSTCVFVPKNINVLFTKADANRGLLPIGVSLKAHDKYQAHCRQGSKKINLGTYDTVEKAYAIYKIYKEKLVKDIAKTYKQQIPSNLYEAMMNYEVDIKD